MVVVDKPRQKQGGFRVVYRKRIEEIDNNVLVICASRKNKSDVYNLFEETQNECRQWILDIHREIIVRQCLMKNLAGQKGKL